MLTVIATVIGLNRGYGVQPLPLKQMVDDAPPPANTHLFEIGWRFRENEEVRRFREDFNVFCAPLSLQNLIGPRFLVGDT